MNLEHLLTDEDRQIREAVRDFTKKEIIPNAKKLEADYSLVEAVHQKLVGEMAPIPPWALSVRSWPRVMGG